jgi:hypothetical protein
MSRTVLTTVVLGASLVSVTALGQSASVAVNRAGAAGTVVRGGSFGTVNVQTAAQPPTADTRTGLSPVPRQAASFRISLPEPTSSFGAVAAGEYLYVYGGHIARTHTYSKQSMSGRFSRLKLDGDSGWERLADGPKLQGMNLSAYNNQIYRVGGMEARNPPGSPQDLHSVADVARFDPARATWEPLPPLPTPRSSHDVVVVGDMLYVLGGWAMSGSSPSVWAESVDILDLSSPFPSWTSVPQPFKRRAFIVAAAGDRIYVLGGMDHQDKVQLAVDVFDVRTGTWSQGPTLPAGPMNGFSPAACTVDGRVYISLANGSVHRLRADGGGWEPVAANTPRIVHRLVPHEGRILVLGGSAKGTNLDLIEAVEPLRPPTP